MNYFEYMASYIRSGGAGVCLPMVELTTEPGLGTDVALTPEECSLLNAAYKTQFPIVCKFSLMGMTVSVAMVYVNSPASSSGYIGMSAQGDLYVTLQDDGTWTASFTAKG